jgi:hypothetical protein
MTAMSLRMTPVRLTCPPEMSRDVFDQLRVPDHHMPQREGASPT